MLSVFLPLLLFISFFSFLFYLGTWENPGTVRADGIPVPLERYDFQMETDQLAVVDVSGNTETLRLFISTLSLAPGNTTVVFPFPSNVSFIDAGITDVESFREDSGIKETKMALEKQEKVGEKWRDEIKYAEVTTVTQPVLGPAAPLLAKNLEKGSIFYQTYTYTLGEEDRGGGDISVWSYEFEGGVVEIVSSSKVASVEEYFSSIGVDVQDSDIQAMINKYGVYHAVVLQIKNSPPVEDYDVFVENHPEVIDALVDFVKDHPSLVIYHYYDIPADSENSDEYYYSLYVSYIRSNLYGSELYDAAESLNYYDKAKFARIFMSVYSKEERNKPGVFIVLEMGMNAGGFFPLGTSPSWDRMGDIEILFRCDRDTNLRFLPSGAYDYMKTGFYRGKHVYLYTWEPSPYYNPYSVNSSPPSYDIFFRTETGDNAFDSACAGLKVFLYDVSGWAVLFLSLSIISVFWGLVFPVLQVFLSSTQPPSCLFSGHRKISTFAIGFFVALGMLAMGVFSLLTVLLLTEGVSGDISHHLNNKNKRRGKITAMGGKNARSPAGVLKEHGAEVLMFLFFLFSLWLSILIWDATAGYFSDLPDVLHAYYTLSFFATAIFLLSYAVILFSGERKKTAAFVSVLSIVSLVVLAKLFPLTFFVFTFPAMTCLSVLFYIFLPPKPFNPSVG